MSTRLGRFLITGTIGVAIVSGARVMLAQQRPRGGQQGAERGPRPDRQGADQDDSPTTLPAPKVEIVERDGYRVITANGIPNHKTGQFPSGRNPNRISAQKWEFRVTLAPKANDKPTGVRMNLFGVALNGIPFDPATAEFWKGVRGSEWVEDSQVGTGKLGIDLSNAHVQPGGVYHYHGIPLGLVDALKKEKPDAAKSMLQVGWAADGFPVYASDAYSKSDDSTTALKKMTSSYQLKKGTRPAGTKGPGGKYDGTYSADWEYVKGSGDLDECNGRTGVTPEFADGTFYYVLTDEFPFVPRMWKGTPDESFMKKGPPGGMRGGPEGRNGPPPDGRGPRGRRGGEDGDDRPPPPPPEE